MSESVGTSEAVQRQSGYHSRRSVILLSDHLRAMAEKEAEIEEWKRAAKKTVAERVVDVIADVAEKDAELATLKQELTVAREYLAHMHNTEECLAKAIEENEDLTMSLATLKARCEGMREALGAAAESLGTLSNAGLKDQPLLDTMQNVRGYANSRVTVALRALSSLPVEGLVPAPPAKRYRCRENVAIGDPIRFEEWQLKDGRCPKCGGRVVEEEA